jgi:hypothetical protein
MRSKLLCAVLCASEPARQSARMYIADSVISAEVYDLLIISILFAQLLIYLYI